jgi:hypothetical protein
MSKRRWLIAIAFFLLISTGIWYKEFDPGKYDKLRDFLAA